MFNARSYNQGRICMVGSSYLLKIFMLIIIYQQCWKFSMCLIFMGQGYPQKLFNLEHFPIYGIEKSDKFMK